MKLPFLGGKKRSAIPAPARVASLVSQGIPEAQIIRAMREEGYSPVEIDRSLKMAVKSQAGGMAQRTPVEQRNYPQNQYPTPYPPQPAQRMPEDELELPMPGEPFRPRRRMEFEEDFEGSAGPEPKPAMPELPELPRMNFRPPSEFEERGPQTEKLRRKETIDKSQLEEIAEGIIQEKWKSFEKRARELDEKILSIAARMDSLENMANQLRNTQRSETEQIKSSILSYKQGMDEMASKLESIDRSVKDSMTPMLQTLRSMSDTIRTIKKKAG